MPPPPRPLSPSPGRAPGIPVDRGSTGVSLLTLQSKPVADGGTPGQRLLGLSETFSLSSSAR
ncbi:hypothetical protein I79_003967 [Cricetulus griseus]|uniref:Uncharacterized protein n=1 Tax=Cricetulus griseus TaxID=10029 RepID=G3H1E2_CRIGR|nr:hypothetical protein I79_003967 [Cricetulus griseus]